MRIAVDCYEVGKYATGAGRVVDNILICLLDIFSDRDFFVFTRERIERYARDHVEQVVIPSPMGYFRWQNGPFFRRLKAINPEILIASNYTLPFFNRWRSVLFEHDVSFASHPEWFSKRESMVRRYLVRRSLKKAEAVVTGSEFSKNEIVRCFHTPQEKIKVFLYGIEDRFQRKAEEEVLQWKERKGLKDRKIIGYLGAIFNRRNIPLLVESVDLLRKERPETILYLIGRDLTHPPQNMEDILSREWIRWETHIEESELPLFYSSLEAFAYLSLYEGFGLPPLEALACGTVSVLLNRTSLKEIFEDMAIMVDEPEAPKIKEALETAMTDGERRKTILNRFQEEKPRFSWSKAAHEISLLCKDIAS